MASFPIISLTEVDSKGQKSAVAPFMESPVEVVEVSRIDIPTASPSSLWASRLITCFYFAMNIISTVSIVFLNKL